jgi:GTP-binding protein
MTLIDTEDPAPRLHGSIEHQRIAPGALGRADVAAAVSTPRALARPGPPHHRPGSEESTGLRLPNKWDLVHEMEDKTPYLNSIKRRLRFATWAPVVVTSALQGIGLEELLREVRAAGEERKRRVQTSELNAIMRGAIARRPPPPLGRKRLKLLYVTQARTEPPTFVFFVNDAALISSAYKRYLENNLRRVFGFRGAGLHMIFRTRGEE